MAATGSYPGQAGTGGVSVHPGCRWTCKGKPPAANADPAEELLRSLSILGRAGGLKRPCAREITHTVIYLSPYCRRPTLQAETLRRSTLVALSRIGLPPESTVGSRKWIYRTWSPGTGSSTAATCSLKVLICSFWRCDHASSLTTEPEMIVPSTITVSSIVPS